MEKPASKIPTKAQVSSIPIPLTSKSRESQRARSKSVEQTIAKMNGHNDNERYQQGQNIRYGFDSFGSHTADQNKVKQPRKTSLTRDSYTALHDNQDTKSEFSKVFKRDHRQLPEFDKDFGPFGATVLREVQDGTPEEDISTMFHRSETVTRGQRPATVTGNSWIRTDQSTPGYSNEKSRHTDVIHNHQSRLPFLTKRSPGYGYTAQDLDDILAKYKTKPSTEAENEFQSYQMTSSKYENVDPDFTQGYPFPKNTSCKNDKVPGSLSNQGGHLSNHVTHQNLRNDQLGTYGKPIGNHQEKYVPLHTEDPINITYKTGNHTFPFKETADGKLIVLPEQVAFESKKVSILVADPEKIGSIRTEKIFGTREQEIVTRQVEEVIQTLTLSQNFNKDANWNVSKYDSYGKAIPSLDQQLWNTTKSSNEKDEYADKEIVAMKYSDSTQGTGKLMVDLHQRIRTGSNADTHIVIGDKIYPCHSIALEVYSTFFDQLSRPRESIRKIQLPEAEVSPDIFPTLMNWIMQNDQGRDSVIVKTNVVALFSAAQYLDISELKSQCIHFLHEKVETNDRHLMQLWDEVKKRRNTQDLMTVIASKAASSFQQIYKSRQFLNLDIDEIVMLLSSDDIVIESELDAYDTAIRWLLHQWSDRNIFTNQIMSTVRFGLLTPLQLTQIAHCPDFSKGNNAQEYAQVLAYGSVKSMIDDGLAFSIVEESYKNQPDELTHWIETTGIRAPRPRTHLNLSSKSKSFSYHKETTQREEIYISRTGSKPMEIERKPSYTIFRGVQPEASSKSVLMNNSVFSQQGSGRRSVADNFQDGGFESGLGSVSGRSRSRTQSQPRSHSSNSQRKIPTEMVSNAVFSSSDQERPYSSLTTDAKSSNLEQAAQMLGQPIKQEDIAHLTGSANSSTASKDKVKHTPTNQSWH